MTTSLHERSDACIRNHVIAAMAAAVIPVPVADMGAITMVELDMLRALTAIFGRKWSDNLGKQAVGLAGAAVTGHLVWSGLASGLKFLPGIGSAVGGALQMTVAGAVCFALGKAYQKHLESGGETIDEEAFRKSVNENYKEGKHAAEAARKAGAGSAP